MCFLFFVFVFGGGGGWGGGGGSARVYWLVAIGNDVFLAICDGPKFFENLQAVFLFICKGVIHLGGLLVNPQE